jgi:CheY-like chemotaxis protein
MMPANRDERGDGRWRIAVPDRPDGGDPVRPRALLVDDNAEVLVTIGAFLAAAGFDVVPTHNGDEALAQLGSGQMFVLMVTDYAMPGISGVDLATQALERLPALKVLVITGFPSDAGLFDRPASVALLAKPFRRAALIAAVRSLLKTEQTNLPAAPD